MEILKNMKKEIRIGIDKRYISENEIKYNHRQKKEKKKKKEKTRKRKS